MSTAKYNIYPTLVQCFGIILIGYLAARFKLVSVNHGKGISLFISTVALPALIFKAMVEVKFSLVNWKFWSALFISKAIVFVVVLLLTLLFQKHDKFGAAGLYSIFVSQSNDIAFGLPLLSAVFSSPSNKALVDYIFLAAPISLALLNPIGFGFLEYQKAINTSEREGEKLSVKKIIFVTVKGILTNPLVFMILFGIAGNFIFDEKIPPILDSTFTSLGNAFGATALFYLGWRMGCQQFSLSGLQLSVPVVLVLVKGIFLPLIMVEVTSWIIGNPSHRHNVTSPVNHTDTTNNNSTMLETYSFLYGAIPTAPTVLVYAAKYNLFEEIVGSGLILGTLFSAPVIFASIRMLEVRYMTDNDGNGPFANVTTDVGNSVCVTTIVCSVYVLLVFFSLKMYKRMPHLYTIVLVFFQFLLGVMGTMVKNESNKAMLFFLYLAILGIPVWCTLISVNLSLIALNKGNIMRKWRVATVAIPAGILLIVCGILVATFGDDKDPDKKHDFLLHSFKKKLVPSIVSLLLNTISIISSVVSFVLLKKSSALHRPDKGKKKDSSDKIALPTTRESLESASSNGEKHVPSEVNTIKEYENLLSQDSVDFTASLPSTHLLHHVLLLLIMVLINLLQIFVTVWDNMVDTDVQGFLAEVKILEVCLQYGQGFFSFAIFGFIKELFQLPIFTSMHEKLLLCQGRRKIVLDDISELSPAVLLHCHQFVKSHMQDCIQDIVTDLKFRLQTYEQVFDGTVLVDWLIQAELVTDRDEAVKFGNILLQGRVIEHCMREHHFHDGQYFYQFTKRVQKQS